MPPRDTPVAKVKPSPLEQEVINVIEEHQGANKGDIELEKSLTEDLGLNPGEVEDILQDLANHFEIEFSDLKGQHFQTVGEIAVAIDELQSFG